MRSANPVAFLFLAVLALIAVPAAASEDAPAQPQQVAAAAQLGGCPTAGAVDLAAVLDPVEAPVCSVEPQTQEAAPFVEPVEQKGPPHLQRFCRCGCGIGCETDADCGGGSSCDAFVTCC